MNTQKSPLISFKNVGKTYKSEGITFEALKDISLDFFKGELIGLSGKSGSGKTTLLNVAGLIDPPTTGELFIDNVNIKTFNDNQLSQMRSQKIGFIFQTFNLLPLLSALENVEYPLMLLNISEEKRKEMALEALRIVGLSDFIDRRPGQLSGGQRQRVAIARAIVKSPEIILADEPTANLDSKTSDEIFNLLLEIQNKLNVTIIICSHDEELINKTRRHIKISDGHLLSDHLSGEGIC